jgi:hypothetical protein
MMSTRTLSGLTRPLLRASLLTCVATSLFVATALAAGNSVQAHPPSHAKVDQHYTVKLTGFAKGTKTLYVFIDYSPCAATPAVEFNSHHAAGVYGRVSGQFSKTSGWKSHAAGNDHVCTYLVKKSEPLNPTQGIVAHDFVTFKIHK